MSYFELGIEPIDMLEDLWWVFYPSKPVGMETRQPLIEAFQRIDAEIAAEDVGDPNFRIIFRLHSSHFELVNSGESSPSVFLGMRGDEFLPADTLLARQIAERFLELGRICYGVLKPIYAFTETLNAIVNRENVEARLLTHMFWAQYFGPDFVQRIGQDILLRAPGWRNENMSDGGLLYVLGATPYLRHGPRQHWGEAKRYFNQHLSHPVQWLGGNTKLG